MSLRTWLSMCVCVGSLVGCGHPIRDLVHEVKDLVPEDEKKDTAACDAEATTSITPIANLHAGSPTQVWDPARPEATSSFVISAAPFTSEGQAVDIRIFFTRGNDGWTWHALANQRGSAPLGSGHLRFDSEGALEASSVDAPLRLPRTDGSLSPPVIVDVGRTKDADHDGFGGVTSTSEPSGLHSYEQNGSAGSGCS